MSAQGHDIHGARSSRRLHAEDAEGNSRYEFMRVTAPVPDVVLTRVHVHISTGRRSQADDQFSESALYGLVRRNGAWWLAG